MIYYRGFQLVAHGPHVTRQTIFVAHEAFGICTNLLPKLKKKNVWYFGQKLTPFSVQLQLLLEYLLFEKFCLRRLKFDQTAFL
jgi:hypothetical protein